MLAETEFMGTPATADIEEEAEEPWNALVGASWAFSRHVGLTLEGGFGKREQWMVQLGYRF